MSKIVEGVIVFSNRLLRMIEIYYSPQSKQARLRVKAIQYADISIDSLLEYSSKADKKLLTLAVLYGKKYKIIRKKFR